MRFLAILMAAVFLALTGAGSPPAYGQGAPFINPLTGQYQRFVAANYTDIGVDGDGNMPADVDQIENNARDDLDRLRNLGISNVRIWAFRGFSLNDYGRMAERVGVLANLAAQRGMTLTVDLIDASGQATMAYLWANDTHINRMIDDVLAPNAGRSNIYWSLGNEIGGYDNPQAFADYYEAKVAKMRSKGSIHISFQPIPGSLEHRWWPDTKTAAIRVINASDDISVHFYAASALATELAANRLEFTSTVQWIQLAHAACKPATIGEFSIIDLNDRTDGNIWEWLEYFDTQLKVDQVSFWQFTKNEGGHVDGWALCESFIGGCYGSHVNGANGFLGEPPSYPGSTTCGPAPPPAPTPTPPPAGDIGFLTGSANPVYIQANHGQYLCSENGNAFIVANRDAVLSWETFYVYPNSDGTFSLKATNGLFLDVDRSSGHYLKFNNGDSQCADCKFRIEPLGGDIYGIRPAVTNLYLSSENGQQAARADRTVLDAWERWTIRNIQGNGGDTWATIAGPGTVLAVGYPYYSANAQYRLIMQTDGNLVLYRSDNTAVWHSHTYGNPGSSCIMQTDGNLVIYNPSSQPLWHTHTFGNNGAYLQISDQGQIRIRYNSQTLWTS